MDYINGYIVSQTVDYVDQNLPLGHFILTSDNPTAVYMITFLHAVQIMEFHVFEIIDGEEVEVNINDDYRLTFTDINGDTLSITNKVNYFFRIYSAIQWRNSIGALGGRTRGHPA